MLTQKIGGGTAHQVVKDVEVEAEHFVASHASLFQEVITNLTTERLAPKVDVHLEQVKQSRRVGVAVGGGVAKG